MKRLLLTAAALALLTTAAHAGLNLCEGTVRVGKEWTTVKGPNDDCRFKTASPVGRRILAACPDGSECQIDLPLSARSGIITSVTSVRQQEQAK
jgi:hypothetical protein